MSTDNERPVILKSTMDATGVRRGAEEVKQATREMAQAVGAEGRKAGDGLAGVGEGAKKGADTVERETRSMIASIQRAQAATEAGGRGTAAYYEAIARQRGISADALAPYIAGLRQAEAAQKAAEASLGSMGLSAKQTTAALRQVPAQFTDIVTSLASGQAPLTVFLQQGGQLKDVFGGAGAAARALGGYIASLVTPATVLGGAVVALAAGYVLGGQESQEFTRALVLSGNAAGATAGQLTALARSIAAVGPATQGKAAEVLTQLAAAGEVGAQNLQRFAQAAIDLERAGGPAAEETAKAFAALARDPLAASIKLTESVRYLSAATAAQIQELERQGRTTEAARLAQEAYASAVEQRVPQLVERLGLVEKIWQKIKDATKGAGDAVLDIGRPIDELQREIARVEGLLGENQRQRPGAGDYGQQAIDRGNEKLRARLTLLQQGAGFEALSAAYQAQRVKQEEAGVQWLKEGDKYLTSRQRLEAEVVRIRALGLAAGQSELQIAERLKLLVQQTYGSKADTANASASRERERALEAQARLLQELSGVTSSYAEDLAALEALRRRGVIDEERYGELLRELVARQPAVRQGAQDRARAAEEEARALARSEKAWADYIAGLDRGIQSGDANLQRLRDEYVELTAGREVRRELQILELERLATTYDQAAAIAELNGEEQARYQRLAEQVREEIRWRRNIATATAQADARTANERAAADAAQEWQRTADQIGQSLADALIGGGKSAGQVIKDYFRTLVLQPTIKALVQPVADAVRGFLGLPGGSGAGAAKGGPSGLGNLGGALSSAASALGLGDVAKSIGNIAGQLGPQIQAALLGRAVGQAISGGYSLNGGSGNSAVNIGLILGGPIGAVIGGAVNRLFGRKLKDFGFEGSFGAGGDFSGNNFQFLKGGVFRSNKTRRSELDADLAAVLDAGGQAAFAQAKAYADVLGLPVDALAGYTQQIKVSLKGLSEEEAQKAVAESVAAFQEGLLGRFATQLEPLRRTGESLSQVAERVAGLQVFTRSLNELGGVFGQVAGLSIDAREQLIALAGGMEALQQQSLSFVQQYYNREEIAGLKAREIQQVLTAAGITTDVATKEQFRSLVEGTDVSTDAGRQRLAQLLAIAGDFAQVAEYLAETGGTLAGAAALAPATGQLAELFAQPQQAQIDAINTVASGIGLVKDAVERLIGVVQEQTRLQEAWETGFGA